MLDTDTMLYTVLRRELTLRTLLHCVVQLYLAATNTNNSQLKWSAHVAVSIRYRHMLLSVETAVSHHSIRYVTAL
jgi:hypothetical protein